MFRLEPFCLNGQEPKKNRRETQHAGIRLLIVTLLVFIFFASVSGFDLEPESDEEEDYSEEEKELSRAEECGHAGYRPKTLADDKKPDENIRNWPWMVAILTDSEVFCSGTLITKFHVLTSASCLYGMSPSDLFLMIGVDHLILHDGNPQHFIREVFTHPKYEHETRSNDIAVIKLSAAVKMVPKVISTICLPEKVPDDLRQFDLIFNNAILSGWNEGFLYSPDEDDSDLILDDPVLKHITAQFYVGRKCRKACHAEGKPRFQNSVLCITSKEEGYSVDDSHYGWPLIKMMDPMRWKVIGIFSKGCQGNSTNGESIITRVGEHISFIKSCIEEKPNNYLVDDNFLSVE